MGTKISALPAAGAITGAELVPVDQGGVTVQTTTGATGAINPVTAAETAAGLTPVNFRQPSDQSLIQALRYNASTSWDYRTDQRLFEIYLSKYGAVFNGTTDDAAAIADAINAMQALVGSGAPRRVIMPGGLTAKIATAGVLTMYCGGVGIDFNGLVLDASSLTAGNVITVNGRGSSPASMYAAAAPIENFNLIGSQAAGTTSVMLALDGSSTGEVGGEFIRNFSILGGGTGIEILNYCYVLGIYNGAIEEQVQNALLYTGGTSTGENVSLHKCALGNSSSAGCAAINIPTGGGTDKELFLYGCSIDYADKLIVADTGTIELDGCHLESSHTADAMVTLSHSAANAAATTLRVKGVVAPTAAGVPAIFSVNATGTVVLDLKAEIANYGYTIPIVDLTAGTQFMLRTDGSRTQSVSYPTLAGVETLYNGGFEAGTSAGWTATGSGVTWTVPNTGAQSGTYCLQGVATVASSASQRQTFSVKPGQQIALSAWINIPAYTSGSAAVMVRYYQDSALATQVRADTVYDGSAATAGWVETKYVGYVPAGANFAIVQLLTTSFIGTVQCDTVTGGAL